MMNYSIEINISKIDKQMVYLQSAGFQCRIRMVENKILELILLFAIAVDKLFSIISN